MGNSTKMGIIARAFGENAFKLSSWQPEMETILCPMIRVDARILILIGVIIFEAN